MSPQLILTLITTILQLAPGVIQAIENALKGQNISPSSIPPEAVDILNKIVDLHKSAK